MLTAEAIYQAIINDPQNAAFTAAGAKPLYAISPKAKLLIVGQAPSRQAQASETFWDDPSGDRLRAWMGVSRAQFYDSQQIAVLPLDFYFPGKGKSGDLPPRMSFAKKWHPLLLKLMPDIQLALLIGAYAQRFYLGPARKRNLTATVQAYQSYLPAYFPLVHPSPLNFRWQKQHPWFEGSVVPALQQQVQRLL